MNATEVPLREHSIFRLCYQTKKRLISNRAKSLTSSTFAELLESIRRFILLLLFPLSSDTSVVIHCSMIRIWEFHPESPPLWLASLRISSVSAISRRKSISEDGSWKWKDRWVRVARASAEAMPFQFSSECTTPLNSRGVNPKMSGLLIGYAGTKTFLNLRITYAPDDAIL